eukprot:TRINITY_DN10323_c0_g2_i5.p2 TRINITY_DN10323_c0_g2~~TRINITY_DN10323_c0_g2_i5.p2  ORF type:complete len:187 (-),score=-11.48 TRINITY_DN10323_c0_g2_i5:58-579(-)
MCMHVAHVVHLDLGVTFFGVLNCCFNGSQCRCNGSKIIRQQHLCFRFHKKCCYIEVVVIKGALITGVHCTCIFIIMFVHVCVILDIILYAWQVIIVFVCINSIIIHMCFICIIMCSANFVENFLLFLLICFCLASNYKKVIFVCYLLFSFLLEHNRIELDIFDFYCSVQARQT